MNDALAETGLAMELREGTAVAHREAESAAFVKRFFRGELRQGEYAAYLAALYPVYGAMEELLEGLRTHPALCPFHLPAMFRGQALAEDLGVLYGERWRDQLGASAAAHAYAQRIREVGDRHPALLVAHVYTRYLGDLSGGQIMGRVARRTLGLTSEAGLAFYRFDAIPDLDAFKQDFRARLDALPADRATRDAIVAEAVRSFRLSHAVFREVG